MAQDADDAEIVAMSLALYREDPAERPVAAAGIMATLTELRNSPLRGRAVVFRRESAINAYAFLISFWSNELGGEICTVDELYVKPEYRGQGLATDLIQGLRNNRALWPRPPVAISLEVTPSNRSARALYEKLGFQPVKNAVMRLRF